MVEKTELDASGIRSDAIISLTSPHPQPKRDDEYRIYKYDLVEGGSVKIDGIPGPYTLDIHGVDGGIELTFTNKAGDAKSFTMDGIKWFDNIRTRRALVEENHAAVGGPEVQKTGRARTEDSNVNGLILRDMLRDNGIDASPDTARWLFCCVAEQMSDIYPGW